MVVEQQGNCNDMVLVGSLLRLQLPQFVGLCQGATRPALVSTRLQRDALSLGKIRHHPVFTTFLFLRVQNRGSRTGASVYHRSTIMSLSFMVGPSLQVFAPIAKYTPQLQIQPNPKANGILVLLQTFKTPDRGRRLSDDLSMLFLSCRYECHTIQCTY